jgi:hypothetical protein
MTKLERGECHKFFRRLERIRSLKDLNRYRGPQFMDAWIKRVEYLFYSRRGPWQ